MDVVANAAVSVDGKLSTRRRERIAISGPEDFARVDRLRAECDGIMVGVGTVLADDPSLTVDDPDVVDERRETGESGHPIRVVADSRARTPRDARLFEEAGRTMVLVSEAAPKERVEGIEDAGATVIVAGEKRVDLTAGLAAVADWHVESLLVEGGGELFASLFAEDLIDELTVYVSPIVIGGRDAPTLVDGDGFVADFPRFELVSVDRLGDGVVLTLRPE